MMDHNIKIAYLALLKREKELQFKNRDSNDTYELQCIKNAIAQLGSFSSHDDCESLRQIINKE